MTSCKNSESNKGTESLKSTSITVTEKNLGHSDPAYTHVEYIPLPLEFTEEAKRIDTIFFHSLQIL